MQSRRKGKHSPQLSPLDPSQKPPCCALAVDLHEWRSDQRCDHGCKILRSDHHWVATSVGTSAKNTIVPNRQICLLGWGQGVTTTTFWITAKGRGQGVTTFQNPWLWDLLREGWQD